MSQYVNLIICLFSTDPRINFIEKLIDSPEEDLEANKISIGILGMPRPEFDAMLIEIPQLSESEEAKVEQSFPALTALKSVIMDIMTNRLPEPGPPEALPSSFPSNYVPTADQHALQREEARIMWKKYMAHRKK